MAYLPSYYSAILKVMFSFDNCTHFVKNETFENDCNTLSAGSLNMCCLDLILDLFGDMNLNQCYLDTSYRNFTSIQFECVNPSPNNEKINNYLVLLIILGLFISICCVLKWTQEVDVKRNRKKETRKRKRKSHCAQ